MSSIAVTMPKPTCTVPWLKRALVTPNVDTVARGKLRQRGVLSPSFHTMSGLRAPRKVALRGDSILADPFTNKGSAFTAEERKQFGIASRLPVAVNSLDEQCERAWAQLEDSESDLKKNQFLWSLRDQSVVLFFALLSRHLTDLFPIIYTPTEAEAISSYSHVFRRPQGACFLSLPNADTLEEDLSSHFKDEHGRPKGYDLIVVSDGEAILGIGDQGSGGVGISTAKAVIYSLVAGIDPRRTLSVILDVGTNSEKLLKDDLYLGWRHERVRGNEYHDFVDRFIKAARKEMGPGTLIHCEDFGVTNAQHILNEYRDTHALFNDDIQGTGCVTLAALQSALKVTKEKLTEQRIIVYGAGSAGLGIARQIRDAMVLQGLSTEDANRQFWLIDKEGLLTSDMDIRAGLKEFARQDYDGEGKDLGNVVKKVHPTCMIGTSTHPGAFSETVVKEMSKHVERPIIFPLSNPTKLHECQPKDANEWTKGKALMATGSPFPPVKMQDGSEYVIAECNNALIYPGIGFGAIVAKANKITDKMLLAATTALAELSPAINDPKASLLPDFADSRKVNFEIALAVLDAAIDEGVANVDVSKQERRAYAEKLQWSPEYEAYTYDKDGDF